MKKILEHQECSKLEIYALVFFVIFMATTIGKCKGLNEAVKMWPEPLQIEHSLKLSDKIYIGPEVVIYGEASYYDYVLDSGWSSVGHHVCATRIFPRGYTLMVTNLDNGKGTVCLTTDYGPDAKVFPDRVIDLSSTAFADVADLSTGTFNAKVKLACTNNCAEKILP